ncbi:MAG: benzoyl-CoA 2,3-epoxidase subunit BoxB, partial [Acidimicrobiia bacterium]
VYLLQKYFGRDGREEANDLLRRQSGNAETPRMLGAFNEETPDWLSFFMFTYFTDRDGKMQLEALAQSGFDPLSRTCRFMLAEEAHHMFVGYTGVKRVVEATSRAMAEAGIEDPHDVEAVRSLGVIDLPTIQRKTNLHYSLTLDLFGSEESTNAANFFNSGLKGRFHEDRLEDDHRLLGDTYPVMKLVEGTLGPVEVPALNALNARLRDDFMEDCLGGISRWNREIASHGIEFEITLPHVAFNRDIGEFSDLDVSPDGAVLAEGGFESARHQWLPTGDDRDFIESLMQPSYQQPGEFASWIAPPTRGIDQKPADYEYVKLP